MKHNDNEKLELKERGPVWKIKVGIHSEVSENRILAFSRTRNWKMKVILN